MLSDHKKSTLSGYPDNMNPAGVFFPTEMYCMSTVLTVMKNCTRC